MYSLSLCWVAVKQMNLSRNIGGKVMVDFAGQHHRQVDLLCADLYSKKRTNLLHLINVVLTKYLHSRGGAYMHQSFPS